MTDLDATYVRRTRFLFLRASDQGELIAVSILAGHEIPLTYSEANLLLSVPADRWIFADSVGPPAELTHLVKCGLLLANSPSTSAITHLRRDRRLTSPQWNLYAALYYSLTRWQDCDVLSPAIQGRLSAAIESGPPPVDPFYETSDAVAVHDLPLLELTQPLGEVLLSRKTTREFDISAALTEAELALVLRSVFGVYGTLRMDKGYTVLRKTSPSGGGQHPIEVYPLIRSVEGLEPGLYHYRPARHQLALVQPFSQAEVAAVIEQFAAGQHYFASAPVAFILAARFARTHWKYPAHDKALRVIYMDAGHLSQTLYLVCESLGLGAFITAAINEEDINSQLKLETFGQGAIAMCGCGTASAAATEPQFEPYLPGGKHPRASEQDLR